MARQSMIVCAGVALRTWVPHGKTETTSEFSFHGSSIGPDHKTSKGDGSIPDIGFWCKVPGTATFNIQVLSKPTEDVVEALRMLVAMPEGTFSKKEVAFLNSEIERKLNPPKPVAKAAKDPKIEAPAPTKKLTPAQAKDVKAKAIDKIKAAATKKEDAPKTPEPVA